MCPGKEALSDYLSQLFSDNDIDDEDTINYKQWVHTDRTTKCYQHNSLYLIFCQKCMIWLMASGNIISSTNQSSYLRSLKENIPQDTVIILSDFAENYSFVVQDAVQGHHWDNSQGIFHPFAVYHCANPDNDLVKCLSICVISDCLKHDLPLCMHSFQNCALPSQGRTVSP